MKRLRLSLVLLAAIVTLLALPARGGLLSHKTELPEWYRKLLHRWQDYKVLVISGKNPAAAIEKLMASPDDYRIVVWQVLPEFTRSEDTSRVLQWVSDGGTVWFQDSRLGEVFGFENAPIGGTDFPTQGFKPTHGQYGGSKREGANMFGVANPGGGHGTLAGVDYVQMFVLRVGDGPQGPKAPGFYSAVRRSNNVTPLLRFDPTSNSPLSDRLAAGVRPQGDGCVVFKPLIWEEQYTGGRFQYNLLEWSSGFGVPDMTAGAPSRGTPRRKAQQAATSATPVADATLDEVTFFDKHVESGTIVTKEFKLVLFEPTLSSGTIAFKQVRTIMLQVDGAHDVVTLKDGKRLVGSVSFPDDLAIRSPGGSVKKVKKSEILRVTVHDAPDEKGK